MCVCVCARLCARLCKWLLLPLKIEIEGLGPERSDGKIASSEPEPSRFSVQCTLGLYLHFLSWYQCSDRKGRAARCVFLNQKPVKWTPSERLTADPGECRGRARCRRTETTQKEVNISLINTRPCSIHIQLFSRRWSVSVPGVFVWRCAYFVGIRVNLYASGKTEASLLPAGRALFDWIWSALLSAVTLIYLVILDVILDRINQCCFEMVYVSKLPH